MKKNRIVSSITFLITAFVLFSCSTNTKKSDVENINKGDTIAAKHSFTAQQPDLTKEVQIDTLRGIDVSHFQGDVNWAKVKASGMHFGIAKATQGITYTDPKFETNWKNIYSSGLYRGAYHFYVANDDPIDQAKNFVNTVKLIGTHHLPPVLDLEGSGIGNQSVADYQKGVLSWLKFVEDSLSLKPMIYTNHPFGNKYLDNERFLDYDLWIAEYGSKSAKIPTVWFNTGWSGWQFTSHDSLHGVQVPVDESRFLSSLLINSLD